ncbi:MAG: phage terminase large subunit, partial [Maricaulis sp.]|nr:phage terminase large subunit [Maricaulis sp.]
MIDPNRFANPLRRSCLHFFVQQAFTEIHGNTKLSKEPYLEAMCFALQNAAQTDAGRLLVTIPPRHLKSIASSVALAAWLMGNDPTLRIMVATYGDDLSHQHAHDFGLIVRSNWYRQLFPAFKIASSNKNELRTTANGVRRSVTVGGATTGFGADLIIIDDLMKAQDVSSQVKREASYEYYCGALLSRFDNPKRGSLISIQQRLHEDDLAAHLIATQTFEHLNLPLIAEAPAKIPLYGGRFWYRRTGEILDAERWDKATADQKRAEVGSAAFSAQYQQNPVPPDGAVIRIDNLSLGDKLFPRDQCTRVVQSWDTAAKTGPRCDFSVCTTWGFSKDNWHLLDLVRVKLEYPDLKARMLQLARKWRPDRVLVEDSSNGTALIQQFRADKIVLFQTVKATGSKLDRLIPQLDALQSGAIIFPTQLPWWDTLRREMAAFPDGTHDDQVDSISQFLHWLGGRRGRGFMQTNLA